MYTRKHNVKDITLPKRKRFSESKKPEIYKNTQQKDFQKHIFEN